MNREQAGNILDAYVLLSTTTTKKAAEESLREVILDAMTSTTYYPLTIRQPYNPNYPESPLNPSWTRVTCANGHMQEVKADDD